MNTKEQFEKLFNNEMPTDEARKFLVALYEKAKQEQI